MCQGNSVTPDKTAHACACGGHGHAGDAVGRFVEAATELTLPPVTFPSSRLLALAGEAKLRELVRRHHALLLTTPVASLFTADPQAFGALVDRVADFIVEACGGPAAYTEAQGSTCMRTRHFPFTIDEAARETWLEALYRAMDDVAFPEEAREEYWNWLEAFSVRMVNRRTMKPQPVRLPYGAARLRFGSSGMPCGLPMRFCPHG